MHHLPPDPLLYSGDPTRPHVMVVDDEEILRLLLQETLEKHFALALVETAEEAIALMVKKPPDVMVVDKNLPGMSGLELMKQAKQLHPDMEVMVITGYASLNSAIDALRLGAYDYLLKPFDDIELVIEKVKKAAEKKKLAAERRRLFDRVVTANRNLRVAHDKLRQGYLQTLSSMITALEARDAYTRGHSDRVARYSAMIGKEMDFEKKALQNLIDGALLHDLGKIGIREDVLNKKGKLSSEEYQHIKTHPVVGAEIMGKIEACAHLVPIIKHHHERMDGAGYPSGLTGEEIPLVARIVAVADAFDAMTSERPYREQISSEEAIQAMHVTAGPHLDPKVVAAFVASHRQLDPVLLKLSQSSP